jgi:hypothetical protein
MVSTIHLFLTDQYLNIPLKFEVGELITKEYKMPADKKDNCFITDEQLYNKFHFQDIIGL